MDQPPLDTPTLSDGVITLRAFRQADASEVAEAMADGEIARWTATIPWPYGRGDAERWIGTHDFRRRLREGLDLAITAGDDQAVGAIGLDLDPAGVGQVGYWVAPAARNRGYARRALALVCGHAIDVIGIPRLRLLTIDGNVASERVAAAAGFAPIERSANHDLGSRRATVTVWTFPAPPVR